jgi:hypothetical protein
MHFSQKRVSQTVLKLLNDTVWTQLLAAAACACDLLIRFYGAHRCS